MYRQILVPLDGDRGSERIVPWVRRLARSGRATVRLLAVRPPGRRITAGPRVVAYADQLDDAARAESTVQLQAVAARLLADGVPVEVEVRFGEPVDAILDAARDGQSDLIALASFGTPATSGYLTARVVRALLRRSRLPVLVARRLGQRAA